MTVEVDETDEAVTELRGNIEVDTGEELSDDERAQVGDMMRAFLGSARDEEDAPADAPEGGDATEAALDTEPPLPPPAGDTPPPVEDEPAGPPVPRWRKAMEERRARQAVRQETGGVPADVITELRAEIRELKEGKNNERAALEGLIAKVKQGDVKGAIEELAANAGLTFEQAFRTTASQVANGGKVQPEQMMETIRALQQEVAELKKAPEKVWEERQRQQREQVNARAVSWLEAIHYDPEVAKLYPDAATFPLHRLQAEAKALVEEYCPTMGLDPSNSQVIVHLAKMLDEARREELDYAASRRTQLGQGQGNPAPSGVKPVQGQGHPARRSAKPAREPTAITTADSAAPRRLTEEEIASMSDEERTRYIGETMRQALNLRQEG